VLRDPLPSATLRGCFATLSPPLRFGDASRSSPLLSTSLRGCCAIRYASGMLRDPLPSSPLRYEDAALSATLRGCFAIHFVARMLRDPLLSPTLRSGDASRSTSLRGPCPLRRFHPLPNATATYQSCCAHTNQTRPSAQIAIETPCRSSLAQVAGDN
jgi:hypothetical protein